MTGGQPGRPPERQAGGGGGRPVKGPSALFLSRSSMQSDVYRFAAKAHAGQRQESDESAYIEHPVTVARLLQRSGFGDDVVAAGLLHDTVEDSGVQLGDLEREFGPTVAQLVAAMTEPVCPGDFRTRKAAHRSQIAQAGCAAAAIFAADKIASVQNLRRAMAQRGEVELRRRLSRPLDEKLEHYRKTLELLEELAPPPSLTSLLREELASFEAERSSGRATKG